MVFYTAIPIILSGAVPYLVVTLMTETNDISRTSGFISWLFQLLAAIILLQTLYYKLAGAAESVYIFESLGMEPLGRYGSGVIELFAGLLLLVPRLSWIGALLGSLVMSVALYVHIFNLGLEIKGDGGAMFYLAVTTYISCLAVIWIRRKQMVKTINDWWQG